MKEVSHISVIINGKHALPLLLALQMSMAASAQRRVLVADIDSKAPVGKVKICTDRNRTYTTDYTGHVVIDTFFKTATVAHPTYLSRIIDLKQTTDTIFLLPNMLKEVVIFGEKPIIHFDFNFKAGNGPGQFKKPSGYDFLGWLKTFEKGHRPSRKEQEKNKKIWKNY